AGGWGRMGSCGRATFRTRTTPATTAPSSESARAGWPPTRGARSRERTPRGSTASHRRRDGGRTLAGAAEPLAQPVDQDAVQLLGILLLRPVTAAGDRDHAEIIDQRLHR